MEPEEKCEILSEFCNKLEEMDESDLDDVDRALFRVFHSINFILNERIDAHLGYNRSSDEEVSEMVSDLQFFGFPNRSIEIIEIIWSNWRSQGDKYFDSPEYDMLLSEFMKIATEDLVDDLLLTRSGLINTACTIYKVYNDYGWT